MARSTSRPTTATTPTRSSKSRRADRLWRVFLLELSTKTLQTSWGELAGDEAVEDVGLRYQALVEAEVAHDRHEDDDPADDDVDPLGFEAGVVDAIGPRSRWRGCGRRPRRPPWSARSGGCDHGRRSASPISTAATVRHRAGQADEAPGRRGLRDRPVDVVLEVGPDHRHGLRQLLGRWAGRCAGTLGEPHASDVDRHHARGLRRRRRRTRWSRRRCRRRGTGRRRDRDRPWRRRRTAGPPRSPESSSGSAPTTSLAASKNSLAVAGVAGRRRGGHADAVDTVGVHHLAVLAQHGDRALDGLRRQPCRSASTP